MPISIKSLGATLVLSLAAGSTVAGAEPLHDLAALQWQKRVLLIRGVPATADYPTRLRSSLAGVDERDLVWFRLAPESVATNYPGSLEEGFVQALAERYFGTAGPSVTVVLLGKDGGVKARYRELDVAQVFALIDSMPMRQREMGETPQAPD